MASSQPVVSEPDAGARRPLAAGDVVDGFRLEEQLHEGGMARLWRVSRVDVDVDGAAPALPLIMKVPRIRGGEEPAAIVAFEVEQMIMPALAGPHVPRFVAKGDFTRLPYIVMERIEGPSLRERFDAAPLPIDEVARFGAKLARQRARPAPSRQRLGARRGGGGLQVTVVRTSTRARCAARPAGGRGGGAGRARSSARRTAARRSRGDRA